MIESEQTDLAAPRRPVKSEAAFRTISEVSEDLDVPQHVLRFWESKFPQIKPLKRGGGRRYYRPEDVQLLRRIRDLLYKDGYTIRGVQKLLRDQGKGGVEPKADADKPQPSQLESPILTQPSTLGGQSSRVASFSAPPSGQSDVEVGTAASGGSSGAAPGFRPADIFAQAQAAIEAASHDQDASVGGIADAPGQVGGYAPGYMPDHRAAEPLVASPRDSNYIATDPLAQLKASNQRAGLVAVLAELEELREILALARNNSSLSEKK